MPEAVEERLRARLARYGSALEDAATGPAPAPVPERHLIVVDGPVGNGGPADRRRPWRGPVARVAAAVVVLALAGGATWAATRPAPGPPTTTERGWADGDVVGPEDRPSAFAALDGTWPLPPGGSLRFVLDRPAGPSTTFAGFRRELAGVAACLWFRHTLEAPGLGPAERATVAAIPGWPGLDGAARPPTPGAADPADPGAADAVGAAADPGAGVGPGTVDDGVAAALSGDRGRLRAHLRASCVGTAAGLGRPEIGGDWLRPGDGGDGGAPTVAGGAAVAVDPAAIGGWDAVAERLGPQVGVDRAVRLPGGGYHVSLTLRRLHALSLTIGTLDGPVTLPVTDAAFAAGHDRAGSGVEVYAGPVRGDDDATVVHAVGADGRSLVLSIGVAPDRAADLLGDLATLAVDLHTAVWPR